MNTRTKSVVEDIFLLIIFVSIAYAIYYFLFSNEEKTHSPNTSIKKEVSIKKSEVNQTKIEVKKMQIEEEQEDKKEDKIKNEPKIETKKEINEAKIEEKQTETKQETKPQIKQNINENLEKKELAIKETKQEDKSKNLENYPQKEKKKHKTVSSFYKEIEDKIYKNIDANISKDIIVDKRNTKIRITILKDGMYEQMTFVSGNEEYYENIKPFIIKIFPLTIPQEIQHRFPRYFRMEVKF